MDQSLRHHYCAKHPPVFHGLLLPMVDIMRHLIPTFHWQHWPSQGELMLSRNNIVDQTNTGSEWVLFDNKVQQSLTRYSVRVQRLRVNISLELLLVEISIPWCKLWQCCMQHATVIGLSSPMLDSIATATKTFTVLWCGDDGIALTDSHTLWLSLGNPYQLQHGKSLHS